MAKKAATKKTGKKQSSNKGPGSGTASKARAARPEPKSSSSTRGSAKAAVKKAAKTAAKKTAKKPAPAAAARASANGAASAAPKSRSKASTKSASKPAAKTSAAPASKSRSADPKPAGKPTPKNATPAKPAEASRPAAPADSPAPATPETPADAKSGRKGITIVNKKTTKKVSRPKAPTQLPRTEPLLGDGAIRKPLIPSGPSVSENGTNGTGEGAASTRSRSAFNDKQLQEFRDRLIIKRAELLGDISTMEAEALLSNSGNLSRSPSHIGDYGSDSFEQTLTLNLAAADRRLLREIDDALQRIADGVFGTCELTGKPIGLTRLRELPWTRYSIEAARELESRAN